MAIFLGLTRIYLKFIKIMKRYINIKIWYIRYIIWYILYHIIKKTAAHAGANCSAANCELRTANCELRTKNCELRTADSADIICRPDIYLCNSHNLSTIIAFSKSPVGSVVRNDKRSKAAAHYSYVASYWDIIIPFRIFNFML